MKNLFLLSFLLISGTLQAQPTVLSSQEYRADGFDYEKLLIEYPELVDSDRQRSNRANLSAPFIEILKKERLSRFMVLFDAFVNEKGTLDFVTFHIGVDSFKKNELSELLRKELPDRFKDWRMPEHTGRKLRLSGSIQWQTQTPYRPERKGDSVLNTLAEAGKVIDTLRIKALYFHKLDLTEAPYDLIYRFPNLEVLDLHENKLTALNLDMARLPKLKNLDLRTNQIGHDKLELTKNKSLKILNMHTNGLTDVPDAARACKRLESLWLGGNKELALGNRSFRRLRTVNDLNFYGCELATLPSGLRKLRRLQVLDLYYNQFTELPKSVTKLRKLNYLAVANNRLTALPDRIDRLKKLQVLYAHHNHLSALPERITRLSRLELLDLGYNFYSVLPGEILKIEELRELDLSGNNLMTFPTALTELVHLEKLHLRGNPFLRQETEQAYLPYIKKLESHPTEVYY